MIRPLLRFSRRLYIPRLVPFIMLSTLAGFILSCGLQRQGERLQLPPAAMIQDIRITEGVEKTIVEIEGEEPMIYTTFRLSDPDRLVIDMAEVDLSRFANEIQVENGPIRAIRPGNGGGSNVSRLEFVLSGVVETDVRTEGLNLVVEVTQVVAAPKGFRFFEDTEDTTEVPAVVPLNPSDPEDMMFVDVTPPQEQSEVLAPVLPDLAIEVTERELPSPQKTDLAQVEALENKQSASLVSAESPPVKEKEMPLPVAKKVSSVRFETGDVLKLVVSSDGILSPRTFFIGFGAKRRLVIDLPGVKMLSKQSRVTVFDHRVKQVRLGQHAKKLRLVLDLLSPISYHLTQHQGNLEVLIEGPEKKEASREEDEAVSLEVAQGISEPSDLENLKPEAASAGASKLESPEASADEPGLATKPRSFPISIPMPSPSIAAAATLPLPLPVPDAESEADMVSDEVILIDEPSQGQEEEAPPVEAISEMPQTEEMLEPLQPELVPEDEGSAEVVDSLKKESASPPLEPLVQKTDEGLMQGEISPESPLSEPVVPVKAEVTLSSPEPSPMPPLLDTPEEGESSEEEAEIAEREMAKLTQEKAVKKKVILRRKRRETVAAKREAIALANAAQAEAAKVVVQEKYTGRKISLDFQDAEITNVVRLIADVSGLNFVMGDDVKGKITVKMNDVPWDQALEIILEIRNLGMEREGDIIRIATLSNLTKQRNEKAEARATKIRAEELLTRVIYINYAKAKNMKTLLLKLLSARGEIMVATRVNALVIKDIAGSLDQVEQMAKKLDTKTPQVLIEARIVEVQPKFKRSLGVQWGADFKTNNGGNSIGIGNFSGPGSSVFSPVPGFAVNTPAAAPLGGIGFSFGRFTESPFQLDLRISAGESQEMTRIVSTPKIMVLDNHEALIKQGAQIPFQSSSPNGGTNVQLIDASLQLKVTPHISSDGGILLELNLTKNEPGPPVQGSDQPSIFEKEVSTQVLLMDGETMVIGGIYETKKTESESGIPFLKDIPGLGWLFKSKDREESTTELLIFITPTVMD